MHHEAGVYSHAGAFSDWFSCHVHCSCDDSAARVTSQLSVCWSLRKLLCSWVLEGRSWQLHGGPEVLDMCVNNCPSLCFPGGCRASVCVSVRQESHRVVLGKHRRCPWLFGRVTAAQSCFSSYNSIRVMTVSSWNRKRSDERTTL